MCLYVYSALSATVNTPENVADVIAFAWLEYCTNDSNL